MIWILVLVTLPYSIFTLCNTVCTHSGKIEGITYVEDGKIGQAFLGIPFAEPPIGNLRFRKPVPIKPWKGILKANRLGPACPQTRFPAFPWVDSKSPQSEDCLYMNIWVPPNTRKDSYFPVMLWIFSGAFTSGSKNLPVYNGQKLAAKENVIVVNINYRLGIIGFLSTISDEAPGNMGLYDVLEAMKWVHANSPAFGGDNNRITLFGQSSGSMIAGLMCVTPLSKGLFHRIIMEGGSAATDRTQTVISNTKLAQKVAKAVHCPSPVTNPEGCVKCLRSKSYHLLTYLSSSFGDGILNFQPITDLKFFPMDPSLSLATGNVHDVDVMFGHTQDEGSIGLTIFHPSDFGPFGEKNPKVNKSAGGKYMREFFKDFPPPVQEMIVQYYLGDLQSNDYDNIRKQVYHSIGDFLLICPDIFFGESYAKKNRSVYAYYFNHIPSKTPWAPWMGSVHFDEVAFVFGRPLDDPSDYTQDEICLSRRMMNIWANFAKYGYPGNNWKKFTRYEHYYKMFNIQGRESYLQSHEDNCEFIRQFTIFK